MSRRADVTRLHRWALVFALLCAGPAGIAFAVDLTGGAALLLLAVQVALAAVSIALTVAAHRREHRTTHPQK